MSTLRNLIIANQSSPTPPPVEEWVEIERVRFDGNTYVDTGFKLLGNYYVDTTWSIPNYSYSTTSKYFCGSLESEASTSGVRRWFSLQNTGLSSNKRKSSFRGSSAVHVIESDTTYTSNVKCRFVRGTLTFAGYQEVDGVETQVFSKSSSSGSNVTAGKTCYIGAVNFDGTATAGYSTSSGNLWFYELKQYDSPSDSPSTYPIHIVCVKNTSTGVIALKNKMTNTILHPQKIDPELDFGGILYDTPRALAMMMGKGFEEPEEFEEFEELNNNEEKEE